MTVHFAEYIRKIPATLLLKHFMQEGKSGVLSEAVYDEIIAEFHTPEKLEEKLKALTPTQATQLLQIYLCGEEGLTKNQEEAAKPLLATFLVYEATSMKGEYRLFGFKDLEEVLMPIFLRLCGSSATTSKGTQLHWASLDFVVLLDLIRYGAITLKQTGELSKSSVDLFCKKSSIGNLLSQYDEQSAFLEALLWILYRERYILLHGQSYTLTLEGFRLPSTIIHQLPELFMHLSHAPNIGNVELIESMLHQTSESLPREAFGGALPISLAVAILRWRNKVQLVDAGFSQQSYTPPVVPVVSLGHMMPDHTIIIPPEIEPEALFKILALAEIDRVDMIYHAHIEKQKIIKSVSLGTEPSEIYGILAQWRASDSLIQSVQEWVRSFSQVYIDQGSYLAIEPSQVATICALTPLQGLIEPVSDYVMFKIKSGSEGSVKNCLDERGYDFRKPEKIPQRVLSEGAQLPRNSIVEPRVTNFNPTVDDSDSATVNRVGKYGGQARSLSLDEMCKVIRYALLMEEKLIVYIHGQDQPHHFTPEKLRTGDAGHVEGVTAKGEKLQIALQTIEKMGVLS